MATRFAVSSEPVPANKGPPTKDHCAKAVRNVLMSLASGRQLGLEASGLLAQRGEDTHLDVSLSATTTTGCHGATQPPDMAHTRAASRLTQAPSPLHQLPRR
jgi:hypothetical protein